MSYYHAFLAILGAVGIPQVIKLALYLGLWDGLSAFLVFIVGYILLWEIKVKEEPKDKNPFDDCF